MGETQDLFSKFVEIYLEMAAWFGKVICNKKKTKIDFRIRLDGYDLEIVI